MEKFVEIKASSVDLAVEQALEQLGAAREDVEVEILNKGGLFAKALVRVTVKATAAGRVEEFVNGLLEHMGLESRAEAHETEEAIEVNIEGRDSGVAIGYRGEALDAIQYLVLTFLNQEKIEFKKVVVNSENYREKRRETLTALALRLADKARRTCRKVALEPMNPFERRIIHSALADSEIAGTESQGEEPNRYVVIVPKGVEIRESYRASSSGRYGRDSDNRSFNGNRGRGYGAGSNNGGRRDGRRDNRSDTRRERNFDRPNTVRDYGAPRRDEAEVEDGREFRGYFTSADAFEKPAAKKTGPPKFKSFGGRKKF